MSFPRVLLLCLTAALSGAVTTSCNDSEFSGSSSKAAAKPKPKPTPEKDSGKKPDDKGSDPKATDKNPKKPTANDAGSDAGKPGTADATPKPGTDAGVASGPLFPPVPGVDSGQASGPGSGFVDLLTGLLGSGSPGIDTAELGKQPDDNNVIFGDEKTFHIGDGQMTQSSCLTGISPYPVAGKQYLFEFDVLADGQVAVDIGLVCGVDYSDTNLVYISQNGQPVSQALPLPVGATSFQIPPTPLAKGKYQIGVESRTGTQDPEGNPADADDYVIGKVHIQSKGAKIKIGKVYVN